MYHITKSRSKVKPFSLLSIGVNGEPLNSHLLKTKQACFKNVTANLKEVFGAGSSELYFFVQDDTTKPLVIYRVYENGTKEIAHDEAPDASYIPGRNPKKKKK